MSNNIAVPTIAEGDPDQDLSYAQAASDVSAAQRKELVAKVAELKRKADAAKERARAAQERFEKTVLLLASEKPMRIDWYEYPGALPRKELLKAAKLNTMSLHRIVQRQQNRADKKGKR